MANTPNYNLKKVEYTEIADIPAHFNGNMDVIDSALKSQADELATKETPGGAQAKADTAEDNAKSYASGLIGTLSNLLTTAKNNIVVAVNEIFGKVEDVGDALDSHLAENVSQTGGTHGLEYEHGVFTPFAKGGTVEGTVITSIANGRYVKINKKVFISLQLRITEIIDATGNFIIGGLPFVPNDNYAITIDRYRGITLREGFVQLSGYTSSGSGQIILNQSGSGQTINRIIQISDLTPVVDVFITCTYLIN
jgi:hypothetical protein